MASRCQSWLSLRRRITYQHDVVWCDRSQRRFGLGYVRLGLIS
jgi:hypothetical protein